MQAPPPFPAPSEALRWDVFCHVVDNLGDVGVCWRLCAGLAASGQQVRLWIDRPEPLGWMAPGALHDQVAGVQVLHWRTPMPPERLTLAPADVWVEAFGCELPQDFVQAQLALRGGQAPVWINLEYLSAESYVERSHGLPSPVMSGPARGATRWFFYPGFNQRTGGLLREAGLITRQAGFDAAGWLRRRLPDLSRREGDDGALRVSLFCYEPAALAAVLRQAGAAADPSDWLVTPGRAWDAVRSATALQGPPGASCRLHALPPLPQADFDHLLWACDLNFVRGEDSLVRALWAGQPFVWQLYPQHDNAHHAKLAAFLDWLQAPDSLRAFHRAWNGVDPTPAVWPDRPTLGHWRDAVRRARLRLLDQPDLVSQLRRFVREKR